MNDSEWNPGSGWVRHGNGWRKATLTRSDRRALRRIRPGKVYVECEQMNRAGVRVATPEEIRAMRAVRSR